MVSYYRNIKCSKDFIETFPALTLKHWSSGATDILAPGLVHFLVDKVRSIGWGMGEAHRFDLNTITHCSRDQNVTLSSIKTRLIPILTTDTIENQQMQNTLRVKFLVQNVNKYLDFVGDLRSGYDVLESAAIESK